eukprot:1209591-Pyramimonas_sp.AAC.1
MEDEGGASTQTGQSQSYVSISRQIKAAHLPAQLMLAAENPPAGAASEECRGVTNTVNGVYICALMVNRSS